MSSPPVNPARPYGYGSSPSRLEREARLVLVEELMFRRLQSSQVIERALAKEFGVNSRTIRTYMKRVRERAAIAAQIDPGRLTREKLTESIVGTLNLALDRTKIVEGRAVPDPDLRTALRCQQALMNLHGLVVQRHEVTGPNGEPLTITPEAAVAEMRRIVEDVASRRSAEAPTTPAAPPAGESDDGSEEDEP